MYFFVYLYIHNLDLGNSPKTFIKFCIQGYGDDNRHNWDSLKKKHQKNIVIIHPGT